MDQSPPVGSAPPPPPAEASIPLLARLLNVFATPGEVFDEMNRCRTMAGNFLAPILIASVVSALAAVVIFSQPQILQNLREQQQARFDQLVKDGKMSQADADRAVEVMNKFGNSPIARVVGCVMAALSSAVRVFWWAFVIWLLGRSLLKTRFSYLKAAEMASLACLITVLGQVVSLLLIVNLGSSIRRPVWRWP